MKKATIDLNGCKYLEEIHIRIRDALDFPKYYGKNWSAFGDCINRDCDVDFVTVVGTSNISNDLKESVNKMIEILERNKQFWKDTDYPFDYEVID